MLLVLCDPACAELGIITALSDVVKDGIDKFILSIADRFYEQSYAPPGHEVINGTTTEIFIYSLTTSTVDPWSKPAILEMIFTTWTYVLLYSAIYAMNGFLYIIVVLVSPGTADTFDGVLNRSVSMRSIRLKQYFTNLISALGVLGFTTTLMQTLFTISLFLTTLCIISCMAVKPLAVSADNMVLYVAISIFYAVLSWFFCARGLLLYIFVAGSLIIGALLISNKTRDMGLSIGSYFIGVLLMQPIVVFLMAIGFLAVDALFSDSGIIATSAGGLVTYLILLIILVKTVNKLILGKYSLRGKAVTAVKLVL